jgi:1-acyl-sn-glycerol-3-phosphate acyltransferase
VKALNYLWRITATGFSFLLFGVGTLLLALIMIPLIRLSPLSAARRQQVARRSIQNATWCYLWLMRFLCILSFECKGTEGLNRSGILVVANHPTLLDAVFLMSLMPNTTFIVKAAMARNPITRWMVNLAGYIPNDEIGIELLEKAALAIKSGDSLMIFPEGTRTDDAGIRFKRGAANIALAAACPVVPVLIDCKPMTLRKCEKWYQVPSSRPHFYLEVLPEVRVADLIQKDQPSGIQARQLTRSLETLLRDQLQRLG